jgi:hypothetical protein
MKIAIRIRLVAHTHGQEIRIQDPQGGERIILEDGDLTVERLVDYQHPTDHLDLFRVTGIREGSHQRLAISSIEINGADLMDWREFCQFQVANNRYQPDTVHHPCSELSFLGTFQINTLHRRAQWAWSEDYHSDHRNDFVSDNLRWDCDDTHHCHGSDRCQSPDGPHTNRWLNLPHDPAYAAGDSCDYAALGCSITQGMALPRGTEWPALLARDHRVFNLASPGLGIDAIALNLRRALDRFHCDRVILVLPSYNRRLLRFRVDDTHHRVPVCLTAADNPTAWPSIWMPTHHLREMRQRVSDHLGRHPEHHRRRGQRLIRLMQAQLRATRTRHWITSWNPDVYQDLTAQVAPEHLLPPFPLDQQARDGRHTSARAHQEWLDTVRSQIRQ